MNRETAHPKVSIVLPALNEGENVANALAMLAPLRAAGAEIILADGGSSDRTTEVARPLCDRLVVAPRGRAPQMNAGAAVEIGRAHV